MTHFEWISILISLLVVVVIPAVTLSIRSAIQWTRVQDRLAGLVEKVEQLVEDKERTHQLMWQQAKEDRAATDKRLRWLEETVWQKGRNGNAV